MRRRAFAGGGPANLGKAGGQESHESHSARLGLDGRDAAVTMTHGGVNMSGKQESGSQTYYPDGKERPLSLSTGSGQAQQMPNITIASTWVGTHVLETSAKRDGQPLGQGSYEGADDNRVLTATVRGVDAAGKPFAQVIVFDRD